MGLLKEMEFFVGGVVRLQGAEEKFGEMVYESFFVF